MYQIVLNKMYNSQSGLCAAAAPVSIPHSILCLEPPILHDITVNRVIQCGLGENKLFNKVTSLPEAVVTSLLQCESTSLTILNTYQWF